MILKGLELMRRLLDTSVAAEMPITSVQNRNSMQTEAFIRFLLKQAKTKNGWDASLLNTRYIVVDTETTGFNPADDCLLSLGAVEMEGDRVLAENTFHSYVKLPDSRSIPPHITTLTGIKQSDTQHAPSIREVLMHFFTFAKDAVLVFHHSHHDVRFLNKALSTTSNTELSHRVIDTQQVAQLIHPAFAVYDLDEMLVHYNIPVKHRHHALSDALMTAQLWKCLIYDAMQYDITTVGELLEETILALRK